MGEVASNFFGPGHLMKKYNLYLLAYFLAMLVSIKRAQVLPRRLNGFK